jgi:glycosyltransferase involved in cell wall biosynthesis
VASPATVTVLLPAYNAARWIGGAVESVLRQSFGDFRLLVMDDGSDDATAEIIGRYRDSRISVVRAEKRGLVAVLNHGLELVDSKYVARMDADDLSLPDRLRHQVSFMDAHPDIGICGTAYRLLGAAGRQRVRPPSDHETIAATLFFRSAFGHPTVMMRSAFLAQSGLRYRPEARHAEDYDFWVRARPHTRFANLPQYLLEYRVHASQVSTGRQQAQLEAAGRVRLAQLERLLPQATESEKRLHLRTCDAHLFYDPQDLAESRSWLDALESANRSVPMFAPAAFARALFATWLDCCYRARFSRTDILRLLLSRRYRSPGFSALRARAGFLVRALGS